MPASSARKCCSPSTSPATRKAAISRMAWCARPKGFKEAYKAYCEGGLGRLGRARRNLAAPACRTIITMALGEMAHERPTSRFAMYPGLTAAAYGALIATGARLDEGAYRAQDGVGRMGRHHVPDRARLRHRSAPDEDRAVEQPDGTYRMNGTKIFISGGDQDLTDNIIHMVIAKIPDENGQIHDDLSTVNFFMVPKFLVERRRQDGRAQRRHHRRHRAQDGHQGPGHLRAQFRRRHRLAAGAQARRRPSPARSAPPPPAWRACSA